MNTEISVADVIGRMANELNSAADRIRREPMSNLAARMNDARRSVVEACRACRAAEATSGNDAYTVAKMIAEAETLDEVVDAAEMLQFAAWR